MDDWRGCHFHPKEMVVGVCSLCLNEKLLILASKQTDTGHSVTPKAVLPKIFDFSNLLTRLDIKNHKPDQVYHTSSTSPEGSFISIKFEDNGVASWDRGKVTKMSHNPQCGGKMIKSMIEHARPHTKLRWRKRVGHLLHLIRWKKSSKRDVCQVGTNAGGGKGKHGWIKTLINKGKDQ